MEEIPIIDISSFFEFEETGDIRCMEKLLEEWQKAFSTIGFAIVTGHNISNDVCENFQKDVVKFFSLPQSEKDKYSINQGYGKGGYVSRGLETVAKTMVYNEKDNDHRIAPESRPMSDYVETLEYIQGFEDNDNEFIIPEKPKTFAKSLQVYWDNIRGFYKRLLKISSLALRVSDDYFQEFFQDPYERMRLAFYPGQDKVKPQGNQLRYGAHTDYGFFAIVRQDDAPGGLEVLNENGKWIPVRFLPDSFVINCGDLLQRWTNDCWKSIIHRVVNPPESDSSRHRLSLVTFVGPNRHSIIKPLPTCCSEDNPAKYEAIGCKEHLERKLTISNT
eukprot:gene3174-3644_t